MIMTTIILKAAQWVTHCILRNRMTFHHLAAMK
jgi:hypothetical protein